MSKASTRHRRLGAGLVLALITSIWAPVVAIAQPTSVAVSISDVTLTKDGSVAITAKISGATGTQFQLTPIVTRAISNRTALAEFLESDPKTTVLGASQTAILTEDALTSSIRLPVGTISELPSGLYGFGLSVEIPNSGEATQNEIKLAPWFPLSSEFEVLSVAVVVPITTSAQVISGLVDAEGELLRIANLLDVSKKRSTQLQWLVDPALVEFLSTQDTPLAVGVRDSLAQLTNVYYLPYGQADIAGLLKGEQQSRIDELLELNPSDQSSTIALLSANEYSSRIFGSLPAEQLVPLIGNSTLTNNSLVTTSAHSKVLNSQVLVSDDAASSCFTGAQRAYCLTNELAMITSEAPSKKRSVLVTTPANWQVEAGEFDQLLATLGKQKWLSFTSLERVLDRDPQIFNGHVLPGKLELLPKAQLKAVDKLTKSVSAFSNLISDDELLSHATSLANLGYSQTWPNSDAAIATLNAQTAQLTAIAESLTISVTDVITIGAQTTQIPLTLNNDSDYKVRAKVILESSSPKRFALSGSGLVEIEAGARLTVLVPVTLLGPGDLVITAGLANSQDEIIGTKQSFVLRPTAYTRFAGLLVGISLFVMLGLMSRNLIRRFRKADS